MSSLFPTVSPLTRGNAGGEKPVPRPSRCSALSSCCSSLTPPPRSVASWPAAPPTRRESGHPWETACSAGGRGPSADRPTGPRRPSQRARLRLRRLHMLTAARDGDVGVMIGRDIHRSPHRRHLRSADGVQGRPQAVQQDRSEAEALMTPQSTVGGRPAKSGRFVFTHRVARCSFWCRPTFACRLIVLRSDAVNRSMDRSHLPWTHKLSTFRISYARTSQNWPLSVAAARPKAASPPAAGPTLVMFRVDDASIVDPKC